MASKVSHLDHKICQSVTFGSVFLALEAKIFTPQDLLQWLVGVPNNDRTFVAYKAICTHVPPDEHYMLDQWHFLCKEPAYAGIAVHYNLNLEIPTFAGSSDNESVEPLIFRLCATIHDRATLPDLKLIDALVVGDKVESMYLTVRLVTCYRARNFPTLRIPTEMINQALVEADWVEKLRYTPQLALLVLKRVARLQTNAPIYYAVIGWRTYYPVVRKLYQDKLLTMLSRDQLAMLHRFFPGIIDIRVFAYDDFGYQLSLLEPDISAYVLGFPMHAMIPDENQIHQAITKIVTEGVPSYLEAHRAYIRSLCHHSMVPGAYTSDPINIVNPDDVLCEAIENYAAFDIVIYQQGVHVYRFTRPEFPNLLQSGKNLWTGELLPTSILATIKARVEIAKELGLPPACPLEEILDRVRKETFFGFKTVLVKGASMGPTGFEERIRLYDYTGVWSTQLESGDSDSSDVDEIEALVPEAGAGPPAASLFLPTTGPNEFLSEIGAEEDSLDY